MGSIICKICDDKLNHLNNNNNDNNVNINNIEADKKIVKNTEKLTSKSFSILRVK